MSDNAAAKMREIGGIAVPEAMIRQAVRSRTSAQAATTAAPTENPIFKIIFNESLTPEQQQAALAKLLTFPGTKEESKAAIKAYQEFEEWLQSERERMSKEIIKLTDTETFAELQSVYNDLNGALIEFDERMKPLTDIIEAIYVLRTNDKTMDAFTEIQNDKKNEGARKAEEEKKRAEFDAVRERINNIHTSIAKSEMDTGFFGGLKKTAREDIAVKQVQLSQAETDLDTLTTQLQSMQTSPPTSNLGEFAIQKDKLRELLDISGDEHKQRQRDLVDAALGFVEKAKTRIGSVRTHLGKMTDQIDAIYDANTKMTGVYAVMSDGIKDASVANNVIREEFRVPPAEESNVARIGREEKLGTVEDHIRMVDTASGSTIETMADLTGQTIRIRSMKDSNEQQIDKARRMHNQGVAGVADRLGTVLNAVSAAALGESSAMAKDTLTGMIDRTNMIVKKEVIQNALGVRELNKDIEKAIDDLGSFGEVLRTSTTVWRDGLTDVHANIDRMRQLADEVRGDIREAAGVHADIQSGNEGTPGKNTKPAAASPFGMGR